MLYFYIEKNLKNNYRTIYFIEALKFVSRPRPPMYTIGWDGGSKLYSLGSI